MRTVMEKVEATVYPQATLEQFRCRVARGEKLVGISHVCVSHRIGTSNRGSFGSSRVDPL